MAQGSDMSQLGLYTMPPVHTLEHANRMLDGTNRGYQGYRRTKNLPYLQADPLACHRSMDTGRRHETTGSEAKDYTAPSSTAGGIPAFAPTPRGLFCTEPGETHGGFH